MYSKRLNAAIMEAVDNQMKELPEAKEVYDKLIAAGYSEFDAKSNIGYVLSQYIFKVMSGEGEFDNDAYIKDLQAILDDPKTFTPLDELETE